MDEMDAGRDSLSSVEQVIDCLCGYAVRGYGKPCRTKQIIGEYGTISAECCFQILNSVEIEHPVGKILLDCVSSFHHKCGCSVRTLLCMISVWYHCHHSLRQQGLTVKEVRLLLERLLEISIPMIHSKSTDITSLLTFHQRIDNTLQSPLAASGSHQCQQLDKGDTEVVVSSNTQKEAEDVSWDEVSWYFTSDSADATANTAPPNKFPVVKNNRAEDSDDEFASCFDSVPTQSAPKPKPKCDDISWLNNALSSILLANSSRQSSLKQPSVYSRNLSANSTSQPSPLTKQSDCTRILKNQSSTDASVSSNVPSNDCHSLDALLEGIARYDHLIYDLLVKSVNCLLSNEERLQAAHINNINIVECVGPLSHKSDVYSGLIVTCCADVLQLCTERNDFRAVLFQGDVDPTYSHRGYQNAVKAKPTMSVTEMTSDTSSQSWLADTYDAVLKNNVSCLLMKGQCETTLKANLMSQEVLVLEQVPYAVLKYISEQCQVPILHYTSDIRQVYSCDLNISAMDLQTHSKLISNLVKICLPHSRALAVTAVVCCAAVEQTQVYGERLRHALARLKNIVSSGLCTIDMSMDSVAKKIFKLTGSSEDSLMSEAGDQFIKHLLCIVTPTQVSQCVDDTQSLVAAWKSSLSVVTYLTSLNSIVTVGLTDGRDKVN